MNGVGFFDRPDDDNDDDLGDGFDDEGDGDWGDLARPHRWVGGVVPESLVLGRSDDGAVVLEGLTAFPDGLEFSVHTFLRRRPRPVRRRPRFGPFHAPPSLFDDPEGGLRFGIQWPDGGRARPDEGWPPSPGAAAAAPVVGIERHGGGGGSDVEYRQGYWAWPLPAEGDLAFVCMWPAVGIPETSQVIDGDGLRAAAARAHPVWEDDAGRPSHLNRHEVYRIMSARTQAQSGGDAGGVTTT